jgi:recombination protein RecT
MAQEKGTAVQSMKKVQEETVNAVLIRVNEFKSNGQLTLPKDYAPDNALKAAWFTLLETKDRGGNPVLDSCTKGSITNALFEMVLQGLNPMKKQCAFIAYGNQLQMQREYHGTIALAKRFGGVVKTPIAHIIYEGDKFEYALDSETDEIKIVKHEMKLENINHDKILGCYAIVNIDDGTKHIELMTMAQIQKAWEQGPMKGKSPAHINFRDQMCKKTVISRACKLFISSSDDGSIIDLNKEATPKQITTHGANEEVIDIDAEDVTTTNSSEQVAPEPQKNTEQKEVVKKEEIPTAQTGELFKANFDKE